MDVSTAPTNLSCAANGTGGPPPGAFTWEMALILLITGPLSAVTIVGNLLVIISFRINFHLRTVSNYFLLSLAVADLILGAISMNLYTTYILIGQWTLGNVACDVWLAVDYVASNASVMNLLAISFDRYLSVTRPLTYRAKRTPKRAAIMIALAWGVSLVIWAPPILFWQYIVGERKVPEGECSVQFLYVPVITFCTAAAAFYLPVSIMVGLYWRVYRETEKRSRQLAGLTGTQSGTVALEASRRQQSQSSSSNTSSIRDPQPSTQTVQNSPDQGLGAQVRHCNRTPHNFTLCWRWKRIRDTGSASQSQRRDPAGSSSSSIDSDAEEDYGRAVHVPLAQISFRSDPGAEKTPNGPTAGQLPLNGAATQARQPRFTSLIREKKAARTLSAILLAFIATWTPYNIMVLVSTFCDGCVPDTLWQVGYWLCYVNSTINPVCYALCNKHFRVTFKALLLCRW
uniref:Muscarinic acetylcholine receptor n=2 Tax=Denticeps clupeoides TaxID=299321 RepID=A0AAY4E0T6_9TELE